MDAEILKMVGEILVGVFCGVAGILSVKIKEHLDKKKKTVRLMNIVGADAQIREAMAEARQKLSSDRVKIFQFKNGSYYISGESEQKLTITHIVTKSGLGYPSELIESFTDVPVSFLSGTMKSLIQEKIKVFKTEELDDGSYLKHIFHSNSISSSILSLVYTPNKDILGIMMFSWLDGSEEIPDLEYIEQLTDRIGVLLKNKR